MRAGNKWDLDTNAFSSHHHSGDGAIPPMDPSIAVSANHHPHNDSKSTLEHAEQSIHETESNLKSDIETTDSKSSITSWVTMMATGFVVLSVACLAFVLKKNVHRVGSPTHRDDDDVDKDGTSKGKLRRLFDVYYRGASTTNDDDGSHDTSSSSSSSSSILIRLYYYEHTNTISNASY